ncbi:MAG TPA: L,D-transpeptidase [Longimicrobium sp.]|nr:L,D-transpeptidase [Longimicrobium sp.]
MKIRTLALALGLLAAPLAAQEEAAPPPSSGLRLDLNIPTNRLRVFDGDSVIRTYRVSVGLARWWISRARAITSRFSILTHPRDAARPMLAESGVPWM